MSGPQKLVLVDGSSYLYRAFHALPQFSSSRGEPTGAVLGVINMLLKLIKDESPELIAIVFDAKGKTFRDELFDEYKANRPPMPDDLRKQIAPILDIVARDGTAAAAHRRRGSRRCHRHARDRRREREASCPHFDRRQGHGTARQRVHHLINTMTDTLLDRAGVKAKFGVYPEQIVDYLALIGDTSTTFRACRRSGRRRRPNGSTSIRHSRRPDRECGEDRRKGRRELARAASRRSSSRASLRRIDCDLELDVDARGARSKTAGHRALARAVHPPRAANLCCARSRRNGTPAVPQPVAGSGRDRRGYSCSPLPSRGITRL